MPHSKRNNFLSATSRRAASRRGVSFFVFLPLAQSDPRREGVVLVAPPPGSRKKGPPRKTRGSSVTGVALMLLATPKRRFVWSGARNLLLTTRKRVGHIQR